jgi:hypothetical protein
VTHYLYWIQRSQTGFEVMLASSPDLEARSDRSVEFRIGYKLLHKIVSVQPPGGTEITTRSLHFNLDLIFPDIIAEDFDGERFGIPASDLLH